MRRDAKYKFEGGGAISGMTLSNWNDEGVVADGGVQPSMYGLWREPIPESAAFQPMRSPANEVIMPIDRSRCIGSLSDIDVKALC